MTPPLTPHSIPRGGTICTHCALRLGDNLTHLHYLRAIAKPRQQDLFFHFAHQNQLPQLVEMVADLPNVNVKALEHVADPEERNHWKLRPIASLNSVDAWKNAGGAWERHPDRMNYDKFMLLHFAELTRKLGIDGASPFTKPSDLLFDYDALRAYNAKPFDVLVVNSPPQSGQLKCFSPEAATDLVLALKKAGRSVVTTHPVQGVSCTQFSMMSVTAIGSASQFARVTVGVVTGPMWPCLNVYSVAAGNKRILLCDEDVTLGAPNTICVRSFEEAATQLAILGLL